MTTRERTRRLIARVVKLQTCNWNRAFLHPFIPTVTLELSPARAHKVKAHAPLSSSCLDVAEYMQTAPEVARARGFLRIAEGSTKESG